MKKYIKSDTDDLSLYDKYACDSYFRRASYASESDTPAEVLAIYAYDPSEMVRKAVAGNPNTPQEVLEDIIHAKGNNWEIRSAVVRNPNVSAELLTELAKDKAAKVRKAVADNSDTPFEVLMQLAHDSDWLTRVRATENYTFIHGLTPELLTEFANSEDAVLRVRAARHSRTPVDVLIKLASDPITRTYVAQNPSTPEGTLWELYTLTDPFVNIALAKNNKAPADMLSALAGSDLDNALLLYYIVHNRNTPKATKDFVNQRLRDIT